MLASSFTFGVQFSHVASATSLVFTGKRTQHSMLYGRIVQPIENNSGGTVERIGQIILI